VDCSGKGNLVRVKILPTRSALDLMRQISKNIFDRVGNVLDASIQGEVWTLVSILMRIFEINHRPWMVIKQTSMLQGKKRGSRRVSKPPLKDL
jgi:hypothetical protein